MAQTQPEQHAARSPTLRSTFLYLEDLEPNVRTTDLSKAFWGLKVPGVTSIRVCCNDITGQCLGYAHVGFNTLENAAQALKRLNLTQVNGKVIRATFESENHTKHFIKGLEKSIDENYKVRKLPDGTSNGCGVVQYEFEKSATRAIQRMNDTSQNGRQIFVAPFRRMPVSDDSPRFRDVHQAASHPQSQMSRRMLRSGPLHVAGAENDEGYGHFAPSPQNAFDGVEAWIPFRNSVPSLPQLSGARLGSRFPAAEVELEPMAQTQPEQQAAQSPKFPRSTFLHLSDLEPNVQSPELLKVFERLQVTGLTKIHVSSSDSTGQSLGYAFVGFTTPEIAAQALERLEVTPVRGKLIRVMFESEEIKRKIFIGGLQEWIVDHDLLNAFLPSGSILVHKVWTNPNGTSMGCGFVLFEFEEDASKAIQTMNGTYLKGRKIRVASYHKQFDVSPRFPDVHQAANRLQSGRMLCSGPVYEQQMFAGSSHGAESSRGVSGNDIPLVEVKVSPEVVFNTREPVSRTMTKLRNELVDVASVAERQALIREHLLRLVYNLSTKYHLEIKYAEKVTDQLVEKKDETKLLELMDSEKELQAEVFPAVVGLRIRDNEDFLGWSRSRDLDKVRG